MNIADEAAKLLVPGSLSCLVIAVAAGAALVSLRGRLARIGRVWLIATAVLYCALSSPRVAALVERPLVHGYEPIRDRAGAPGAQAVVVFGNGVFITDGSHHAMQRHTLENVIEAARLMRLLDPEHVITSGGIVYPSTQTRPEADVMRDALVELGVPGGRVLTEAHSRNTYEQVLNVAQLLRARHIGTAVVVTAAPHMPRVLALFRRQGLEPVPAVPLSAHENRGSARWLFSFRALEDSEAASYEYLALAGYWLRGRID